MTAEKLPPWARMSLGYDDDPRVVALGRFGADAGLSRDMHLASIRYCRRGETDGWVPPQEIARLAWPLPYEHAMVLVEHLAEVELIVAEGYDMAGAIAAGKATPLADAIAAGMANGWRVPNYDKWQETAAEVEAYSKAQAERGRLGAEKRWRREKARQAAYGGSMANAKAIPGGGSADAMAVSWPADGEPIADIERDREKTTTAHAGAHAPAHEAAGAPPDDDDGFIHKLMAISHGLGHPLTREQAEAFRAATLAGRTVDDPAAYVIGAFRRDPAHAARAAAKTVAPASTRPAPPPAAKVLAGIRDQSRGGPGDETYEHGAASARAMLANRPGAEQPDTDADDLGAHQDPLPEHEEEPDQDPDEDIPF